MVALRSTLCGAFKIKEAFVMTTLRHQFCAEASPWRWAILPPPTVPLLEVLREDLAALAPRKAAAKAAAVPAPPWCWARLMAAARCAGAVNNCIRLAHSIDGMALWTAEDLAEPADQPMARLCQPERDTQHLHPGAEAMVQCHGSQCGFCTPGFVMSLFGMYQNRVSRGQSISRAQARKTWRQPVPLHRLPPILDAAQQIGPGCPMAGERADLLQNRLLARTPPRRGQPASSPPPPGPNCWRPPAPQAQVVAGATDVGLWVTNNTASWPRLLDVTRAAELRRIDDTLGHIAIGPP